MTNAANCMNFEEKHTVSVNFMLWEEISEKYDIAVEEIEAAVINYRKQTLPLELLVIDKKGVPYIFHAKNPFFVEEEFERAAT